MDRVIDFNELKNRVKDEEIDKFESCMYSLYYQMMEGKMTMNDFTREMLSYAENNNISQEKFINLQNKMMERYGFDSSSLGDQLKQFGIDSNGATGPLNYESARKAMSFNEKYKARLESKLHSMYSIKNEKNDVKLLLEGLNVVITSVNSVDLSDLELNEFLCSYKKVNDDKSLNITICNNIQEYQY